MGKHRERVDIVADILQVASLGFGVTKIMKKANLSYTILVKYLDLICNCGLLNNGGSKYILTTKGSRFLKKYYLFRQKRQNLAKSVEVLNSERFILNKFFN